MGSRHREADDAQRRWHHRQGLPGRPPYRGCGPLAAGRGERARHRHAEQVRAERRSALMGEPSGDAAPRRVLFVTGRLAQPALTRTLEAMDAPFAWQVASLKITVAALMTTEWIARFLQVPDGIDLVMIPGLCEGDRKSVV